MGERGKVGAAAAEKGYDTKPPSHKGRRANNERIILAAYSALARSLYLRAQLEWS